MATLAVILQNRQHILIEGGGRPALCSRARQLPYCRRGQERNRRQEDYNFSHENKHLKVNTHACPVFQLLFSVSHKTVDAKARSQHASSKNATFNTSCQLQIPTLFAPASPSRSTALPSGSCVKLDVTCRSTARSASSTRCSRSARRPLQLPRLQSPLRKSSASMPRSFSPTFYCHLRSWVFGFIFLRAKVLSSRSPCAARQT